MKDLGQASCILDMMIYKDRFKKLQGWSQSMDIDTVLKWFSMKNFKNDYLSMDSRITLFKKDCVTTPEKRECMSRVPYASAIASIMHTMICTRLNMAYSLRVVSEYQSDPSKVHWKMVKTIL